MTKDVIVVKTLTPPIGPFSNAIRGGGFIFLSGQVGQDARTGRVVEGGIEQQTYVFTERPPSHPRKTNRRCCIANPRFIGACNSIRLSGTPACLLMRSISNSRSDLACGSRINRARTGSFSWLANMR